jgi:hypothetical protein
VRLIAPLAGSASSQQGLWVPVEMVLGSTHGGQGNGDEGAAVQRPAGRGIAWAQSGAGSRLISCYAQEARLEQQHAMTRHVTTLERLSTLRESAIASAEEVLETMGDLDF